MPSTLTTLQAQAEQQANLNHTRRLAEIQALAPLLAKLDEFMPAMGANGLTIYPDQIHLTHQRMGNRRMKVLRLTTFSSFGSNRAQRFYEALRARGFAEVHRTDGAYPTALLRSGTLMLEVDLQPAPADPARSAQQYAQRMTDQAQAAGVPA